MLCQFEKLIYPSNIAAVGINSYMIALYRPCEKILDTSGNRVTQVKAVGYCLPTADNLMLSSVKTKPLEQSSIHAQHFKRLPELVIAAPL